MPYLDVLRRLSCL